MTTWRVALAKVEKALDDKRNPGSIYVSVHLTRTQAEALRDKLVKPHRFLS